MKNLWLALVSRTAPSPQNGVRVKTWPTSHQGTASKMHFEDIVMNDVANPKIKDQEYCPLNQCNLKSPSRIKLSNVSFRNIRGTTSTQVVVKLVCDQGVPCQDVSLVTSTWNTTEMKALPCHNARTLSQIYWASNCQGLVPKMLNLLSKSEQIVLLLLYSYLFMFTRLLVYWWTRQKYNTRPLWKVCAVWSYEKKQMSIQTFFT